MCDPSLTPVAQASGAQVQPQEVASWKSQSFPTILRHARQTGTTIVFADEAGLDSRCVYGRNVFRQLLQQITHEMEGTAIVVVDNRSIHTANNIG